MSDNPQAFPMPAAEHSQGGHFEQYGMILRDYHAGQALSALIAAAAKHPQPLSVADKIANDAYRIADAMLAERSKK